MKKIILSLCLISFLSSCYYDIEDELYVVETCEVPTVVSFENDVDPIIQESCAISGCHVSSNPDRQSFETYEGITVTTSDGTFQSYTFINKSMPPSGPLNECDREILTEWVNQGSLNN